VAVSRNGRTSFVDEVRGRVDVFSQDRTALAPRRRRTVVLSNAAAGNALTPDGQYLLVADDRAGAAVLDARRLATGARHAVLGRLGRPGDRPAVGSGAIEVSVSPDSRYAFVSLERPGVLAVYDLRKAMADHFGDSAFIGSVALGEAVVGSAVSPDGRWLYVTSEAAAGAHTADDGGTLSVLDLPTAERRPDRAVVRTVPAGCEPVRVTTSPDGAVVWVTARAGDRLYGFSARRLRSDPHHALLATVRTGEAPVGLVVVDHGRRIVVADSDRFNAPGAHPALTVIDPAAALRRQPAIRATIPAGRFPREMAVTPDGRTLLVTNFASARLEAVDLADLP
jgi:DNA-binding beta-propeller fold protein YncE